jgi:hypothetical protein
MYGTVLDSADSEQFFTNNSVAWSTEDTWLDNGNIWVDSVLRVVNSLNWKAGGFMVYGNHSYKITIYDYNKNGSGVFYLDGKGRYGGSWTRW